jgi:hypothetical protein
MLVHKIYLIVWLELDSNLFEFNSLSLSLEKKKEKELSLSFPWAGSSPCGPLSSFPPRVAAVCLLLHLALGLATPEAQQHPHTPPSLSGSPGPRVGPFFLASTGRTTTPPGSSHPPPPSRTPRMTWPPYKSVARLLLSPSPPEQPANPSRHRALELGAEPPLLRHGSAALPRLRPIQASVSITSSPRSFCARCCGP